MTARVLTLRPLLARLASGFVWRSPRRAARMLFSFAHAEASSRLDLAQAARLTASDERRPLYLRHALDEARHAQLFLLRARELQERRALPPLGFVRPDEEALFETLGEVRFLAFVHRGELRGRRQFEGYRDHFARRGGDDRMRALFDAVLVDERRHEAYTGVQLQTAAGGEREARRALRAVVLWEAWRTWRRAGRTLAGGAYVLTMGALYVALAPLMLALRPLLAERRRGRRPRDR